MLPLLALFPPFDTICALTTLTLIAVCVGLRAKRPGDLPTVGARPFPWKWIAAGIVGFVLVFVSLFLLGLWLDPVGPSIWTK